MVYPKLELMDEKDENNRCRTTREQINCYLTFLETHPDFSKSKGNREYSAKKVDRLWRDLANELNALNGPTRTPIRWKETWSQWKSQIRSRAKKAQAKRISEGRKINTKNEFSPAEERAMAILGITAAEGNDEVPEIGYQDPLDTTTFGECSRVSATSNTYGNSSKYFKRSMSPESFQDSPLETKRSPSPEPETWSESPKRLHRKRRNLDDMYDDMVELLKSRNEKERLFQEKSLRGFESIANSLNNVSAAIMTLAEAVEKSTNK